MKTLNCINDGFFSNDPQKQFCTKGQSYTVVESVVRNGIIYLAIIDDQNTHHYFSTDTINNEESYANWFELA
jgi:hypothetical protein